MKRIRLSNLSLRTVFLFSFLPVTILSISLIYIFAMNSVGKTPDRTERQELQRHSDIIQRELSLLNELLINLAAEYSLCNEVYQKAFENDEEYFAMNIKTMLSKNQSIDLILVLDHKEGILASYGLAPESVQSSCWLSLAIKNNLKSQNVSEPFRGGMVKIGDTLYSVGISPLMDQELRHAPSGAMVVGKIIDSKFIKALGDRYKYKASILFDNGVSFGVLPKEALKQFPIEGSRTITRASGYDLISSLLTDPMEQKLGTLIVGGPNNQYSHSNSSIKNMKFVLHVLLAAFIALSLLLCVIIAAPLRKMERKITGMMESGQLAPLDIVPSTSEVKTVADAFNSLLETIRSREEDIETKDRFIALISHEFKTPITIINAAIQVMNLICKDDITPKIAGYISKINRNSLRQLRLVDNLLDIARFKAGQIKISEKNVDIVSHTKEILDSVRIYAQQKDISLNFCSPPDKMSIRIDEHKYERILLNLISNAIKFTPSGKSIEVDLSAENERLMLNVTDSGIGIPIDKQSLIFERFGQVDSTRSRHAEGTGIGLYLVKSFVTAMGGVITLKSEEGCGSSFTVLFPLKAAENHAEEDAADDKVLQAASLEFSDIII